MTESEKTPERRVRELARGSDMSVGRIRMGKSTDYPPPVKLGGPFPSNPLHRVREFLRQQGLMGRGDRELVAQDHRVGGRVPARLDVADLRFMVDTMDRIRDLAYRASGGGGDQLVMSLIHGLASGSGAGMPAPPVGMPPRVDVGPDGSLRPSAHSFDPFEGGGGTRRTRTCVHCQRRCGDVPGGSGIVNGVPVCSPTEHGRPDCYQLVTAVGGHPLHSCDLCDVSNRSTGDGPDGDTP